MTRDPVCGMIVDPDSPGYTSTYHDRQYHFCNKTCKSKFDLEPASYTKNKGFFSRFLAWVARGNEKAYHGHPPDCCKRS